MPVPPRPWRPPLAERGVTDSQQSFTLLTTAAGDPGSRPEAIGDGCHAQARVGVLVRSRLVRAASCRKLSHTARSPWSLPTRHPPSLMTQGDEGPNAVVPVVVNQEVVQRWEGDGRVHHAHVRCVAGKAPSRGGQGLGGAGDRGGGREDHCARPIPTQRLPRVSPRVCIRPRGRGPLAPRGAGPGGARGAPAGRRVRIYAPDAFRRREQLSRPGGSSRGMQLRQRGDGWRSRDVSCKCWVSRRFEGPGAVRGVVHEALARGAGGGGR